MHRRIDSVVVDEYPSFKRDLKKLSPEILDAAKQAMKLLLSEPQPAKLRLEKLKGYKRPDIYSIHITANHSHKMSFEIRGTQAIMRRVTTHREIDRKP